MPVQVPQARRSAVRRPPVRWAGAARGPTADPSARRKATTPRISLEEIEDAIVDGDSPIPARSGTARAALSHRTFRIVFFGAFASNIGTWMQNVVLGAYGYDITHSSTFVGVIIFAQLGPALPFLPMVGGLLADKLDRKRFPHHPVHRAAGVLARSGVALVAQASAHLLASSCS